MSPETRAFLDAVRTAEDPTPEDERRVLAAVRAAVATSAVAGAGLGLSKASKLLGGGVAAGVKVGGVVVGFGAAVWIAGATISKEPPARPVTVVARQASSPQVAPGARPVAARESSARGRSPDVSFVPPRDRPIASATAGSPGIVPAPTPEASTPTAPSSLQAELTLLAQVQAALARGDGATALQTLDENPSTDRRLLAERRAARVLALCSLGRSAEAERAAQVFLREHPTSVQRTAVERSCAASAKAPR